MSGRMQTTTIIQRTPDGWQRRRKLDFGVFIDTEKSIGFATRAPTSIEIVHEYWRNRQRAGHVRIEDFNPDRDIGNLGLTYSHIDVDMDNPWRYRFNSHRGIYFESMAGKCLSDFPLAPVIDECAIEYFECKSDRRPVAHHIQHNLNGFGREYLRLLLPLAGRDGSTKELVCVGRHLAIQGPCESSQAIRRG